MLVDNADGDSVHLHKKLGELQFHFLRKYIVPAAKRVGGHLLEFAVPENAEVVSGRKNFKTTAKSVGRQTLRNKLGSGSRQMKGAISVREATRVIPTKSAKQISRSQRYIFANISHYSCRVIFGINLLWQFLAILEGKSQ